MSNLHKFKAYFGMVPLDDYEDEYVEEPDQARRAPRRSHDGYAERDDREFVEPAFSKASYAPSRRDEEDAEFDRYDSRPRVDTTRPSLKAYSSGWTSAVQSSPDISPVVASYPSISNNRRDPCKVSVTTSQSHTPSSVLSSATFHRSSA